MKKLESFATMWSGYPRVVAALLLMMISMSAMALQDGMPRVLEQLDHGDNPLVPGCACLYSLPGCQGPLAGRIVDECYPEDGVSLQENTMRDNCEQRQGKVYDCEAVLGAGARCAMRDIDCCGVATRSAYCMQPDAGYAPLHAIEDLHGG